MYMLGNMTGIKKENDLSLELSFEVSCGMLI